MSSPTERVVARGLDGVVIDETAICLADKNADQLYYRGYPIEKLSSYSNYEEVAYLLIHGTLPSSAELSECR